MDFLKNININDLEEICGEDYVNTIMKNADLIEKNVKTMKDLKFTDIEGIFERCPDIFLYFPNDFKTKIKALIEKLGDNYVEKIELDISNIESL